MPSNADVTVKVERSRNRQTVRSASLTIPSGTITSGPQGDHGIDAGSFPGWIEPKQKPNPHRQPGREPQRIPGKDGRQLLHAGHKVGPYKPDCQAKQSA